MWTDLNITYKIDGCAPVDDALVAVDYSEALAAAEDSDALVAVDYSEELVIEDGLFEHSM